MVRSKVIAIDGPAAAGKSTIAQKVAEMLGYVYIDTGAMYRAVTLKALNQNIDVQDEEKIEKMLEDTTIRLTNDKKVYLDDVDVTRLFVNRLFLKMYQRFQPIKSFVMN